MGKPKVEMATADSVTELQGKLEALITSTSQKDVDLETRIAKAEKSIVDLKQDLLTGKIRSVEQALEFLAADVRKDCDDLQETREEIKKEATKTSELQSQFQGLEQSLTGVESLANQNYQALERMHEKAHEQRIVEMASMKEELQEHSALVARKDAETVADKAKRDLLDGIASAKHEFNAGLAAMEKKHAEQLRSTTEALNHSIAALRQEAEERVAAAAESSFRKVADLDNELRQEISKVDANGRSVADDMFKKAQREAHAVKVHFDADLAKVSADLKVTCKDLEDQEKKTAHGLHSLKCESEERISSVLAESRAGMQLLEDEASRLNAFCAGVSGLPTRQVEWRLGDILKHIDRLAGQNTEQHTASFFSPPFEAAGTRGMQLELRVHMSARAGQEHHSSSQDQCSLYLWASKGLQLVFRLFLGHESVILRHSFDGQSPFGMRRIGSLAEQRNPDGSLRLGVEIHESLMECTVEGAGGTPNPMALQVQVEEPHYPIDGVLSVQRYLNHRLLELMQSQGRAMLDQLQKKVEAVRSRATRRVQWRLENAPLLRQSFSEGQAVRSTPFQAAGLSGMQLVFYPQGYPGARPGFCSVFLSCPPGCTVRCWLWAGRWRREARAEPAEKPDMLGRINFCRFENCVDPVDESIELALEIEEAQQATKPGAVTAAVQDVEKVQSCETSGKEVNGSLERADLTTMKVQHHTAMKPAADGVQQLPAIWTTQGFHSFADLDNDIRSSPGTRANTANSMKSGANSPPLPKTAPAGGNAESRKSTPRKGPQIKPMSARDVKYKEYDQSSRPLPNTSY